MTIVTDERCLSYATPGHPERPERVRLTVEKLETHAGGAFHWINPEPIADTLILRAHAAELLARLSQPPGFDLDTPFHPLMSQVARLSASGAVNAMRMARHGEPAFSLLRPPGHHATRERGMGFCYLNNVAIAVLEARQTSAAKVAVLDFDVHHGNGTEAILRGRPGCAYFSVHQHPAYPGTGYQSQDNCHNYPLAPRTPRAEYRAALAKALDDLKQFAPAMVAVSAGFDAYRGDPIARELLEAEDYFWLGQAIRSLGVPLFSVLEGGYSDDLPELILAFLQGMNGC